jgi:hypothetical protein
MKFRIISDEAEIEAFFVEPYNAPIFDSEFSEEDFDQEYWRIYSRVRSELETLGEFANLGDGDFGMNATRGPSRWLSVDLTTDRMCNQALIPKIAAALQASEKSYMVYVSHQNPEYPLFHLLVSNNEAIGWSQDPDDLAILRRFGFDIPCDP